jgi:DNA recombination protein RmuC
MSVAVAGAIFALLVTLVILTGLILVRGNREPKLPAELESLLAGIASQVAELPGVLRAEAREGRQDLREALTANAQLFETRLTGLETGLTTRFADFGKSQTEQLGEMRREATDGRSKLEQSVQRNSDSFAEGQKARLQEMNQSIASLSDKLLKGQTAAREEQGLALRGVADKVAQLTTSNADKQDALKEAMTAGLDKLREENSQKLEVMRATVDEKLQGTLEKRLGESFALVSERLEQVHKGLGEMQNLATGVGDLKRVLTNVKSRGGWGEVQLGMLLEDMLTPDQYATNVKVRPNSGETVEFAVKLPGPTDSGQIWLPIDAKFPHEDYERLLAAQETGTAEAIERAGAALERAVRIQAKTICEKYIEAPHTTDFAILYLPTEGLFAEIIRRPGLVSDLQSKHRIMVQGPTTLAALLTSLQMGFRTLAIEKRSSEVWKVLGEAKSEFEKYGQVWDKLGKQLDTAKRTVEEAGKRTRAVTRKLKEVETLEPATTTALLDLVTPELADSDEGDELDSGDTSLDAAA